MDIHMTFRHMAATEGIRQYAIKKIEKLEKYLLKPSGLKLVFSMERYIHRVDFTLVENKHLFKAQGLTNDMYASVDQAVHSMEEQLKRFKEKKKNHKNYFKTDESKLTDAASVFDLRLVRERQHRRVWKKKNIDLRKKVG